MDAAPKILIIRRDNIGDVLCTTPFIRRLREHLPQAYLALVVSRHTEAVVRHNPHLDAVWTYDKGKHYDGFFAKLAAYRGKGRMIFALRKTGFEYVVAAGQYSPHTVGLARRIGARHVLALVPSGGPSPVDTPVYIDPAEEIHEVEMTGRFLAPLVAEGVGDESMPPLTPLVIEPQALERARLSRHKAIGDGAAINVHLSGRIASRIWSADNFIALIRLIQQRFAWPVQVTWSPGGEDNPFSPGDDGKAQHIAATLAGTPCWFHPTPNLEDLVAAFSLSQLLVCTDGGAMHIMAALDKPVVCLFSRTSVTRWRPWRVPCEIVQKPSGQVHDIAPAEVLAACERLLLSTGALKRIESAP